MRCRTNTIQKEEAPAHTDARSGDAAVFSEKVSGPITDVLAAPGQNSNWACAAATDAAGPARPQDSCKAPQQAGPRGRRLPLLIPTSA